MITVSLFTEVRCEMLFVCLKPFEKFVCVFTLNEFFHVQKVSLITRRENERVVKIDNSLSFASASLSCEYDLCNFHLSHVHINLDNNKY